MDREKCGNCRFLVSARQGFRIGRCNEVRSRRYGKIVEYDHKCDFFYDRRCVYSPCCERYPNCPKGYGDKEQDYSCWIPIGLPRELRISLNRR